MDEEYSRRRVLQAVGAGALSGAAGCLNFSSNGDGRVVTREQPLYVPDDQQFLNRNIVSGGVPKDGIPSIDSPTFIEAAAFDEQATDDTIVFGIANEGTTKCYPSDGRFD